MTDNLKHSGDNDVKLMLQVKHGDIEAYTALYKDYFSSGKRYFKQFGKADGLSEDLAQIVFKRIWLKRKTFRENSTFQAFLNGFTKKVLQEHNRKQRKEHELLQNSRISVKDSGFSDPQAICIFKESLKNIELCKSKLTQKQQQAIELSLKSDFTPERAAKQAHCSSNTFRKRKTDARNKVMKLLKKFEFF